MNKLTVRRFTASDINDCFGYLYRRGFVCGENKAWHKADGSFASLSYSGGKWTVAASYYVSNQERCPYGLV